MKLPSKTSMLFNGAAAIFILAGLTVMVRSIVSPADEQPCMKRYRNGVAFSIGDQNGRPLPPGAVQAKLDGSEWGVMQNLHIERVADKSGRLAMNISLTRSPSAAADGRDGVGGAGFKWHPEQVRSRSSVCLSYDIWLPDGFDFRKGGLLPGIYGGTRDESSDILKDSFAVRFRWDRRGQGGLRLERQIDHDKGSEIRDIAKFKFPAGRWINLQQELTLNTPGQNDGSLRIWIDGDMKFEDLQVNFRKSARSRLQGVYADTRYMKGHVPTAADKPQEVKITPFTLLWN